MYLDRVVFKVLHVTPQTGKVNLQLSKQDMYKLCVRGEYVCRLSCLRVTFILNIKCVLCLQYDDGTQHALLPGHEYCRTIIFAAFNMFDASSIAKKIRERF
jgi:hypothetical protein